MILRLSANEEQFLGRQVAGTMSRNSPAEVEEEDHYKVWTGARGRILGVGRWLVRTREDRRWRRRRTLIERDRRV
ncbi:hypothetical protein BHE74_00045309, partial [Ensete ventricosum]